MSSYLPEKCYVVCTNHMGLGYRKLEHAGGERAEFTVIYKNGGLPWLTREDKKINEDFECKSKWSSPVAFGAFGAGLGTGVAVVAVTGAAVGWIPVAGQIILGVVAVACIAYALYSFFTNDTKCNDRLQSPASQWVMFHQTVIFNNFNAVNKRSFLQCQEGGTLLPFISESLASAAARSIGLNNIADIGLNGLASAVSGLFVAFAAVPAAGASAAGALFGTFGEFGIGMAVGKYIITPATEWEKEGLRNLLGGGSGIYDEMNRFSDQQDGDRDGLGNFTPDLDFSDVDPSTEWYPGDIGDVATDLREVRRLGRENNASRESISQLNEAIRAAESNGSLSPERNPAMRQVVQNVKNGVYGENVRQMFTNKSGNMRGMNRLANYLKAIDSKNEAIRTNRNSQKNAKGRTAGNLLQIFQPFISTIFSELARSAAAKYAEQDLANDSGFTANQN